MQCAQDRLLPVVGCACRQLNEKLVVVAMVFRVREDRIFGLANEIAINEEW